MYKSPIDIIYGQMEKQMEGDILRAVQSYGINVDKEELVRALQYDRGQYEKGYADAMESIVRCKDCKHWCHMESGMGDCTNGRFHLDGHADPTMEADDFCSCGERSEGE
jgi:ubiquitin